MSDELDLLKRRFVELAKKSYNAGIFTFTGFLGLAEQSAFSEILTEIKGIPYTAFGGAFGAERVMLRFGSIEDCGYDAPFPIATVMAEPTSKKFADKLTHRDFLGAILNLGIERRCIGDIVIIDNVGYIFADEDIAEFIVRNLSKVKHTEMRLALVTEIPEGELYRTELREVQVTSERIDAVVARVYSLSREDAKTLFTKGLVFVNGKCVKNPSYTPHDGEKISVRGKGRMIYRGVVSTSRKGKLNLRIELYV